MNRQHRNKMRADIHYVYSQIWDTFTDNVDTITSATTAANEKDTLINLIEGMVTYYHNLFTLSFSTKDLRTDLETALTMERALNECIKNREAGGLETLLEIYLHGIYDEQEDQEQFMIEPVKQYSARGELINE